MRRGGDEQDPGPEGGRAKGGYLFVVKNNQKDLKQMIEWAFAEYASTPADQHLHHEVRSGQLWVWTLSIAPMPQIVSGFAASSYALRMHRHITQKSTGEVVEETDYAITCLERKPKSFYALWRGHWEVENRLHHKRDTVFGEDAALTRKGAAGLMCLRDVLLNLFHLNNRPALRSTRHFAANTHQLYRFLCGS